jgi:integrase
MKPKINHPAKGSRITVEPIRGIGDIKSISKLLADKPRDYLLFILGINNGLRVGDLLELKVADLKNRKAGETLAIREGKTGKDNVLVINKTVHKALKNFFLKSDPDDGAFLFASRKGDKPLTTASVNHLIKKWTRDINLRGNYGAHTLRKTWGYHQRVNYGVGFEIICKRFNHSNPAVTMRYLGIEDREVHDVLMNEIG